MDWARCCIDVNDQGNVVGYSAEVHTGGELAAIHVFPNGPFDTPGETLADMIEWLRLTYGEQLVLSLF